jgi:antitoxin VapB
MPLNIKDSEADRLARDLAAATGETLTRAITIALRERLERVRGSAAAPPLIEELTRIADRAAALPVLDERPESDVLGYDEHGLPTRG